MIKEHNGSTWQGKAYSKIVDTTQQVASFPVVVRPMENAIPSWTIKGNMSQTGTPTPQNPITPSECGERTGNLFDGELKQGSVAESSSVGTGYDEVTDYQSTKRVVTSNPVVCHGATVTWNNSKYWICICYFDKNLGYIGNTSQGFETWITTGVHEMHKYPYAAIAVRRTDNADFTPEDASDLNLVVDTYKIQISSASTTTPVYLGEVESTRKIKKYEITGLEGWITRSGTPANVFFCERQGVNSINNAAICSHYANQDSGSFDDLQDKHFIVKIASSGDKTYFGIRDSSYPSTNEGANQLKAYLQQQYAAGTPVTVWYVLATGTTTTLDEPLRKIGTYSDSVSGTNLSVTAQSPTTIDVDTTLKPSEMDLTYTGLKMCGRKKYAGLLADNPLCGIGDYKDTLNLATGAVTRILKKYEFTGQENWIRTNAGYFYTGNAFSDYNNTQTLYRKRSSMFSHYIATWNDTNGNSLTNGYACLYCSNGAPNNYHEVYIRDNSYPTANDFKAYLAQQYAAGTPVTIWYVLSTPTTETITVPSGLSGTEEGYLNQSGTPTPTNPIYPTANDVPLWR